MENDTITRTVEVNYDLTPQEALDGLKVRQQIDKSAVASMPANSTGVKTVTVEFFQLNFPVENNDSLANQYASRNLVPDPYAQVAVNTADPAFRDKYHNSTHWKNKNGDWCQMSTYYGGSQCNIVNVYCHDNGFDPGTWFGGVHKQKQNT